MAADERRWHKPAVNPAPTDPAVQAAYSAALPAIPTDGPVIPAGEHLSRLRRRLAAGRADPLDPTPEDYLRYAVATGADESLVVRVAAEIDAGKRPVNRYGEPPLYVQADGSLGPAPRTEA